MSADHTAFDLIMPRLADRFTVYAMDRRGRGRSGDSLPWSVEREYEDIAPLADSISEPINLLGYSWSAVLCLEAALLTANLGTLVLFDPGFPAAYEPYPDGWFDRLDQLLSVGNREGVITALMELAGLTPEELAAVQAGPSWVARVAIAHTVPRECRADGSYRFVPQRFRRVHVPTLLLVGSESPDVYKRSAEDVHAAIPASRIVTLEGHGHAAHHTAPEVFAGEVSKFLASQPTHLAG